jgi:Uncharacterized conserved protein
MENAIAPPQQIDADEMANFILDVGVFLMASGAHSGRVWRNCKRIADYWGFHININPTFTGVLLSVWDEKDKKNAVTRFKAAPAKAIQLATLTQISHLSWDISHGKINFDEACSRMEKIKHYPHYHYWSIAVAVGISCACLCYLAGGNLIDAGIALIGALAGSVARHLVLKKQFNQFFAFIMAAFVTTLITGLDTIFKIGTAPEITLATGVLYLVPGVPLINSVIDLLEGFFPASIARSLFAASVLSCIAVGMTLAILLLGINNF